jgi:hypothetical protein
VTAPAPTPNATPAARKLGWLDRILAAGADERRRKRLEFVSAIILSLATVLTAWCGYQAARWNSLATRRYSEATAARIKAASLDNQANQDMAFQASLFVQYITALSEKNQDLAQFLYQRFPAPLKTATDAWLATKPLQNPDAPKSPFAMPAYVLPATQQAADLDAQADQAFADAVAAGGTAGSYLRLTVIFASVLFLAGIAARLDIWAVRLGLLSLAVVVLAGALITLFTYPIR